MVRTSSQLFLQSRHTSRQIHDTLEPGGWDSWSLESSCCRPASLCSSFRSICQFTTQISTSQGRTPWETGRKAKVWSNNWKVACGLLFWPRHWATFWSRCGVGQSLAQPTAPPPPTPWVASLPGRTLITAMHGTSSWWAFMPHVCGALRHLFEKTENEGHKLTWEQEGRFQRQFNVEQHLWCSDAWK